ncbi:MAG: hypothetical protein ACT4PV_12140 [Planctomycetaceae bacterium]
MRRCAVLLLLFGLAAAQERPDVWVRAPADDLLSLFPAKGAGFLISLQEYETLLAKARENAAASEARPPLPARLVRGVSTARIEGDVLSIEARYTAVVNGEGPAEVPFPVEGAALETVAAGGGALAGSSLRFPGPGTYEVVAMLSARLQRRDELRSLELSLPPASGQTVTLTLPAEVEGETGPIVRAFRTEGESAAVVGYPDGLGRFTLWFQPKSKAFRLAPLLSASFETLAEVGEARIAMRTRLLLEVLRAPMTRVDLSLPNGLTVRDLGGKGVKSWTIRRGETGDLLEIAFVEPLQGALELTLDAELPRDGTERVELPVVRVPAAVRYRGTLAVGSRPEVRITALDAEGARRLQPGEGQGLALFEIWSQQGRVAAEVERVAAKTTVESRLLLALMEGGKALRARFVLHVRQQSLYALEPRLPAGWILRSVQLDGAVPDHTYEADGRLSLVIPSGLKPGDHILDVALDTDQAEWVPAEGTASLELANVRSGLDEESGYWVVASDPAFRVSVEATTGLRPAGMTEIEAAGFQPSDRMLFAWRYEAPAFAARFRIERHKPQVSAVVVNRIVPSEREMAVRAAILLRIERAGVREITVSLPKGTGPLVEFAGQFVKEKRAPEPGADPETWTLTLQRRVRGEYRLEISFERKMEADAWSADVPAIAIPGASERGFVVVEASGTTAVAVERNGLREADVAELPEQPVRPPLEVLAYAAHPYRVTLSSRRHDPKEVVQAVALSAAIYGVLTPEGALRCRAEYAVRNNDQPFLAFDLPDHSRLLGVLVAGEPAKPFVDKGRLKLALPRSRDRSEPFAVAIIYETRVEALGDGGEVTLLRPRLDIDVLKTEYTLHLPRGFQLAGHDGDLVPLDLVERETVLEGLGELLPEISLAAGRYGPPPASENAAPHSATSADAAGKARSERRKSRAAAGRGGGGGWSREFDEEVPPAEREPGDPEPQPPESERADFEQPLATEMPADHNGTDKGELVEEEKDQEVARAGERPTPRKAPPAPLPKRVRPERALLSLDIQFLKPDNIVRLQSLAPTGAVTLRFAREESRHRQSFLGAVVGAFLGVAFVARGRAALLRIVAFGILVLAALQFGGLSFLPADLAVGAGQAFAALFAVVVVWRLLRKVRIRRRQAAAPAAALLFTLLFAGAVHAEGEVLAPYDPKDPDKLDRVFLGAEEYHRLRKLAFPEEGARETAVVSAEYEATVAGGEAVLLARYAIVKETEQAERLPLRLKEIAVTAATLDGKPPTLGVDDDGLLLLVTGKGRFLLELTLRPRLETEGQVRRFSAPVRPVANATLRLVHDLPAYEVKVVGLGRSEGELHRLGPVGQLSATFAPKTEGFRAPQAELRAETQVVAAVRDGYTGVAARIRYGISGGTADRFRLRVGSDLVVRAVACPGLAGWELGADGVLEIALSAPAANSLQVDLIAERPAERERTEAFPEIAPLDVLRDAGILALQTLPDLKIEILEAQGLLRARENDAPGDLHPAPDPGIVHSVHRFAVRPFTLRWRVALEETLLRAETLLDVVVERERVDGKATVTVTVERGPGPFALVVKLPKGYEVTGVQGTGLRDWWVRDGELHIERMARQTGALAYTILLLRRGATGSPFEAPSLAVAGAARESGTLRVGGAEGLEVEASEASNLLPEDVARAGAIEGRRVLRAFKYVSVPWRVLLAATEEARDIEATVVSRVLPLEDGLRVETLVLFYARRGLIDSLAFVVPVAGEGDVFVSAPDLREERSEATASGRRFLLTLRTPTRGSASAAITHFVPYGTALRSVDPVGASRTRRFVAVEKVADGEVRVGELKNLDGGVFADLPFTAPETTPQTVARVLVGNESPFAMSITVKRHTFEQVASAVVHRAAAEAVLDRSGFLRVQVSYRVYNRTEQFLRLRLPAEAQLYSVFVAGEGVRPLYDAGRILVPLRKVAIGAPTFDVEVVYAYLGPPVPDRKIGVRLPEVEGIDVRRTTLSLYLPRGFGYAFDTEMERVDAADIAAYEATDIYQEIKELYAVAERGNRWQVERALQNALELEGEARRLNDKVRALTVDAEQVAQLESQADALGRLKGSQEGFVEQTRQSLLVEQGKNRGVTGWESNDASNYAKKAEDAEQLEDFKSKQTFLRETEGRQRQDAARSPDAGAATRPFVVLDDVTAGLDDSVTAGTATQEDGTYSFEQDYRGRTENIFTPKLELATAKGRVSIRIELPLEGEAFHFARLAPRGGVTVEASRRDGRFWEGALALACAAAAILALRGRPRPA